MKFMNELKLLKTTNNNADFNLIIQFLKDNNIAYMVRETSLGGHMKIVSGSNIYGSTSIYVDEDKFEKANSLIELFDFEG